MMYAYVNTSQGTQNATLLAPDWVPLPQNLVGLAQSDLNDLQFPELTGTGYWPCTEVNPAVAGETTPDGTGTVALNVTAMTAIRTDNVVALSSDQLAQYQCQQAMSSKAAVLPGLPDPATLAYLASVGVLTTTMINGLSPSLTTAVNAAQVVQAAQPVAAQPPKI